MRSSFTTVLGSCLVWPPPCFTAEKNNRTAHLHTRHGWLNEIVQTLTAAHNDSGPGAFERAKYVLIVATTSILGLHLRKWLWFTGCHRGTRNRRRTGSFVTTTMADRIGEWILGLQTSNLPLTRRSDASLTACAKGSLYGARTRA